MSVIKTVVPRIRPKSDGVSAQLRALSMWCEELELGHKMLESLLAASAPEQGMAKRERGLLKLLSDGGGIGVPSMARALGVTRQHVQVLINNLSARGHVVRAHNPAHKRSPLFTLSADGVVYRNTLEGKRQAALAALGAGLDTTTLYDTVQGLRRLRRALQRDP